MTQEMTKARTGSRLRLSGHYFFYNTAMGINLPFLPLFLANRNLNSFNIGILLAIGPLTSIFAQMFWGNLADRQNRRKELLISAVFTTALVSFFLTQGKSMVGLAGLLFIYSFFNSPIYPLTDSLIMHTLANSQEYGNIRRWGSFGFALTGVAGGVLFTYVPLTYFGVVAGVFLLLTLAWTAGLPNPRTKFRHQNQAYSPLQQALRTPGLFKFLGIVFLIMTPYNAYTSFLGWHLQALGATRGMIGLAWTIAALSEVVVFSLGARWLKRFSAPRLMVAAGLVFMMRWVAYAFITDYGAIVMIQLSQSLSFALFYLATVEYVTLLVPVQLQSSTQSLLQATSFGVSAIVGSLGGGWLLQHASLRAFYLTWAVMVLVAVLGAFSFLDAGHRKEPEQA
ncbi:MAG: MFS transporter [Desulfitobacteriaceae bacterium]